MEEYAASVYAYIQNCMEDVCVTKNIITWANQKPWMTSKVRGLLKGQSAAFKSGDATTLRSARVT